MEKLIKIKTLKELFELREEVKADHDKYSNAWQENDSNIGSKYLSKSQDAYFFLQRIETQIKYLENSGVFLADISVPEKTTPENENL